jgi:Rod binding domain-containing protein
MIPIGTTASIPLEPASVDKSRAPTNAPAKAPPNPKLVEAAKQFEAVFLRVVMSSLEKAANVGGPTSLNAGQSTYGSMIVDAMSDSISRAGGTGLADELVRSLEPRVNRAAQSAQAATGSVESLNATPKPL